MKIKKIAILITLLLLSSFLSATIYEDAEDGLTSRWSVYTPNASQNVSIANEVDPVTNSHVVKFTADNMSDGFKIGNIENEADAWGNMSETFLKWDFKYNNRSSMYVRVETLNSGSKYLYYGFGIVDDVSSPGIYIRYNLGAQQSNGTWLHFERDIKADVLAAGYILTAINGFFLNGSGSIDNLELGSSSLSSNIYEDAEDGKIDRWRIYTNTSTYTSPTAEVNNIVAPVRNSRVIEFTAENMSEGFIIGGFEYETQAWKNTTDTMIKWDFKYNNRSSIYVRVDTNDGAKFLYYGFGIADEVSTNGRYIRHNLGERPANGTWLHFERDIAADVAAFSSGYTLVAINGFMVNGAGCLDNLMLTNSGNSVVLVANAGADKSVEFGNSISLSGSVSGGDGSPVTYEWTDSLTNVLATTATFNYTPTHEGAEELTLTVENATETAIDKVIVTAVNSVVQTQEIQICPKMSAYIDTLYTLGMSINSNTAHGSVLSKDNSFVGAVFCGAFSAVTSSSDILNALKTTAFPTATNILSSVDATTGAVKAQYELTGINTQAYAVLKSILQASGETDFTNYVDYSGFATIPDLYIDIYIQYVDSATSYIVVAVSDKSQNNSINLNSLVDGGIFLPPGSINIQTDVFTFNGNTLKSDILFVMDDSGSMGREQQAASNAIVLTFGTAMTANGVDWRATVIGTENSRNYLNRYIDNPSENNISKLANQLLLGTNGGDEVGLKKAYGYLMNGDITIRNGSKLAVVLISDEIDHTSLATLGVSDINDSYFVKNKIKVHAIIPETNAYNGYPRNRDNDMAFKMANATGGEVANLRNYLTGYDAMMQKIADNAAGSASTIILSRVPVVASISVSVDGSILATGWSYHSSNNSIVFDAASTPASGANISITYNY